SSQNLDDFYARRLSTLFLFHEVSAAGLSLLSPVTIFQQFRFAVAAIFAYFRENSLNTQNRGWTLGLVVHSCSRSEGRRTPLGGRGEVPLTRGPDNSIHGRSQLSRRPYHRDSQRV